jgi:hypothetical protein
MSVSDAIYEAEREISHWLYDGHYKDIRPRLEKLLEEMDAIRFLPGMDTPMNGVAPLRSAKEIIEEHITKRNKSL